MRGRARALCAGDRSRGLRGPESNAGGAGPGDTAAAGVTQPLGPVTALLPGDGGCRGG